MYFWIYLFCSYMRVIYICMFPACCFRQRTYAAQGFLMGGTMRLELTLFFQFKLPLVGQASLYRGHSPSFLEWVYFCLLYSPLIFDMFIVVCVCVCVCERMCIGVGVVLGFTNRLFLFFLCVWVFVLGGFVALNLLVVRSPLFCICILMSVYPCVCVCVYVCFQLFSFVFEHVWYKVKLMGIQWDFI